MAGISLAGWSLHRRFYRQDDAQLKMLDFPRLAREEFGIGAVELNSPFFASRDEAYLKELKSVADGEGVRLLNIAIDSEGDLCAEDPRTRALAVSNHARWFIVAATLGCDCIRANTGGYGRPITPELLDLCTDSFRRLAGIGEVYGVAIVIENHGGISANPDNVVHIMESVKENIGTMPDFGNVAAEIRYEAMEKMAPYAKAVHAKMHEFDEYGQEKHIDIGRCVKILKDTGYDGFFGIEYEGGGDDHEGVLKAKALLEKYV